MQVGFRVQKIGILRHWDPGHTLITLHVLSTVAFSLQPLEVKYFWVSHFL
jgi:hypothetical protein